MVEFAPPAFALEYVLRRPVLRERVAAGRQRVDQRARRRVGQMADRIGAEFGREAPRAGFPIDDQRARGRRHEREAQQVAVVLAVEPARKQRGGRRIPCKRVPLAIEHVRGRRDRRDGRGERRRQVAGRDVGLGRIALRGELEQIRALGLRQLQRDRDSCERVGRRRHRAPLLDPRVPGRADAAQLRDFLAAQPRRATARAGRQADRLRRQAFAVRANEFAERAGGRRIERRGGSGGRTVHAGNEKRGAVQRAACNGGVRRAPDSSAAPISRV